MKKSLARVKFWFSILLGWSIAAVLNFVHDPILSWALFVVFCVCAIATMLIRCEKCFAYVYRYDSIRHGMPHLKCFTLEAECPNCGTARL